jgi:hypothetical protein
MKKVSAICHLTKNQPIDATGEKQDENKYLGKSVRNSKKERAHLHNSPYKIKKSATSKREKPNVHNYFLINHR